LVINFVVSLIWIENDRRGEFENKFRYPNSRWVVHKIVWENEAFSVTGQPVILRRESLEKARRTR
jgi:hypothetical protein